MTRKEMEEQSEIFITLDSALCKADSLIRPHRQVSDKAEAQ